MRSDFPPPPVSVEILAGCSFLYQTSLIRPNIRLDTPTAEFKLRPRRKNPRKYTTDVKFRHLRAPSLRPTAPTQIRSARVGCCPLAQQFMTNGGMCRPSAIDSEV